MLPCVSALVGAVLPETKRTPLSLRAEIWEAVRLGCETSGHLWPLSDTQLLEILEELAQCRWKDKRARGSQRAGQSCHALRAPLSAPSSHRAQWCSRPWGRPGTTPPSVAQAEGLGFHTLAAPLQESEPLRGRRGFRGTQGSFPESLSVHTHCRQLCWCSLRLSHVNEKQVRRLAPSLLLRTDTVSYPSCGFEVYLNILVFETTLKQN